MVAKPFYVQRESATCWLVMAIAIRGRHTELFAISTQEEANEVCAKLNAAVADLMGRE